jgi:hypothetical protein
MAEVETGTEFAAAWPFVVGFVTSSMPTVVVAMARSNEANYLVTTSDDCPMEAVISKMHCLPIERCQNCLNFEVKDCAVVLADQEWELLEST